MAVRYAITGDAMVAVAPPGGITGFLALDYDTATENIRLHRFNSTTGDYIEELAERSLSPSSRVVKVFSDGIMVTTLWPNIFITNLLTGSESSITPESGWEFHPSTSVHANSLGEVYWLEHDGAASGGVSVRLRKSSIDNPSVQETVSSAVADGLTSNDSIECLLGVITQQRAFGVVNVVEVLAPGEQLEESTFISFDFSGPSSVVISPAPSFHSGFPGKWILLGSGVSLSPGHTDSLLSAFLGSDLMLVTRSGDIPSSAPFGIPAITDVGSVSQMSNGNLIVMRWIEVEIGEGTLISPEVTVHSSQGLVESESVVLDTDPLGLDSGGVLIVIAEEAS